MAAPRLAGRPRRLIVLGVLVALVMIGTASAGAEGTGTIKVQVMYPDAGGIYYPLKNVEVFLFAAGAPHYACTNASGLATFSSVPAGYGYFAATGVGVSDLHCANGEFLTPGTHLKMYFEFQGGIALTAGETKTIELNTQQPPADQMQVCGGEEPTMTGTAGRDVLVGTADRDVISAGAGNDTINGMGGNDTLCGGPGKDRLVGGPGNDLLFGESGNESDGNRGLFGGPGSDYIYGGYGTDLCDGETMLGCETP